MGALAELSIFNIFIVFYFPPTSCVSQREIYTLFTRETTWNNAKQICEDQFGQLLKVDNDRVLKEIQHLDENDWSDTIRNHLTAGGRLWHGMHEPFPGNNTIEFQDCMVATPATITRDTVTSRCGNYQGVAYDLHMSDCSNTGMFICQRNEGDCWYEPFLGEMATYGGVEPILTSNEAHDCALLCRNNGPISNPANLARECWAFLYNQDYAGNCFMYFIDDNDAVGTTVSAYYLLSANRFPVDITTNNPDSILYVKRCFEGVVDGTVYSNSYTQTTPVTTCTTTSYTVADNVTEVCYCSTIEQPGIPEPKSSEAKAEEYILALTIDSANTSSAIRKLTSAEDDRPSAVGVGFVGVAMLSIVFGGVFLMDVSVLYSGVKDMVAALKEFMSPAAK